MHTHRALLFVACVSSFVVGCGGPSVEKQIRAGGSTFAYPMMSKWAGEYHQAHGTTILYDSIGSGRGIEQMIDKSFAFGCTDGPMSDAELDRARAVGGDVIHVPLAMGATAPIYHLEDVKEPLRFTGPILADIFLGKITRWNDPALQDLNPQATLPDRSINVVHRLDSSGTTYIFTDYLSKVSPEWKTRVGTGKLVQWPVGVPQSGNDKVAGTVKQNPDSIGYAELTYGIQDELQYASVKNHHGEFVKPSPASVTAAAQHVLAKIPEDLRYSITDAPGADAYPISGTFWAVLYVNQPGTKGKATVDFLRWVLQEGQAYEAELHYAPLPAPLLERARKKLDQVQLTAK